LAQDQQSQPHGSRDKKQALEKIQHSKARDGERVAKEKDEAPLVADPRNRLADGKVDPANRERKPKGT
jgi:hypothetical protein